MTFWSKKNSRRALMQEIQVRGAANSYLNDFICNCIIYLCMKVFSRTNCMCMLVFLLY